MEIKQYLRYVLYTDFKIKLEFFLYTYKKYLLLDISFLMKGRCAFNDASLILFIYYLAYSKDL